MIEVVAEGNDDNDPNCRQFWCLIHQRHRFPLNVVSIRNYSS